MSTENCQICGQTKDPSVAGHCQGHTQNVAGNTTTPLAAKSSDGLSLKDQLDAIPTPSKLANQAPGANGGGASPRATGQNMVGSGGVLGNNLAGGPRASASGMPQMAPNASTPSSASPKASGTHQAQPAADVPQWMKNYKEYQSTIVSSATGQGAQKSGYGAGSPSTPSYNSANSNFDPPAQSSTYAVMIGIVVLICFVMFAFMMINKPPAATTADPAAPTSTSNTTSRAPQEGGNSGGLNQTTTPNIMPPGTVQPNAQMPNVPNPSTDPNAYQSGSTQNPAAQSTYPPAISPNPVPETQPTGYPPSISPNPVPIPNSSAPSPNPIPEGVAPNTQAPNPVPGTTNQ